MAKVKAGIGSAILLVLFGVIGVPAVVAQINNATVYGSVTDPTKAIVPGAIVTLTNEGTGLVKSAVSNHGGEFSLNYVPVGRYSLKVESAGFEPQELKHIDLAAAQTVQLDLTLKVASVNQSVEVTDAAPLLDLGSSGQRGSVTNTQLNGLPIKQQDWTSLLKLNAGISVSSSGDNQDGSGITMNGLPGSGFSITVDGTNASSDPELPAFGFYQQPNIINTVNNDSIQEVSLVHGIAPASVGGTMSGNVNIITKGGTNRVHGDLYEINSENIYNASNPFSSTGRTRSTFNQYGGALGGPILRNRLFLFGSYGGARSSSYNNISAAVPTPYLYSQLSAADKVLYQPIFDAYPTIDQPAASPTATNFTIHQNSSARNNDGNAVARLDYTLNAKNLFNVRYTRARPYKFAPSINAVNPQVTTAHQDSYNGQWTFSAARWSSNARFGYNRVRLSRNQLGLGSDFQGVSFGFNTAGSELFMKSGGTYSVEDGISYTKGRHNVQFGGIFQRQNSGRTDLNTASMKYSNLADFQNNIPSSVTITFDLSPFTVYVDQIGGYVQDDFKVNQRLTFNLGMRYDYFTVPKEVNGRIFNRGVDPANPQLGPGFGPYLPADQAYHATYNNFVPRLGFSYSLDAKNTTIVRGGFGMFKNQHPIYGGPISIIQDSATQPFRVSLNRAQALTAGVRYPVQRPNYANILATLQSSGSISSNFSNTAISQNFPNPYSEQWMLGMQRLLPLHTVLTVDYVGNRGLHENITLTENLPDRATGVAPSNVSKFQLYTAGDSSNYNGVQVTLNRRFENGFTVTAAYTYSKALSVEEAGLLLESAPQDANNIRADYGLAPFDLRNNFIGSALWSLPLVKWTHTHGFFAKEFLGGWELSGVYNARSGNPGNIMDSRSAYPADRPDLLPNQKVYVGKTNLHQLQYLNPAAFYASPAVATAACPAYATAAAAAAAFQAGTTACMNSTLSIVSLSGAQNRPGTAARDSIISPGLESLDASLGKKFAITEKSNFELKMQTFDALNHHNLSGLGLNVGKSNFGLLSSSTARSMQIMGKLTF